MTERVEAKMETTKRMATTISMCFQVKMIV